MGNEPIPLGSPQAAKTLADAAERREASARAAATPLPGPLADAFIPHPDIKVGNYTVRAFCEADYEYLQSLEHPIVDMLIAAFSGKESQSDYFASGQKAWELCYLLTRPIDDLDAQFKNGVQWVKDAAKKEFSKMPFGAPSIIHAAALKQVMDAGKTAIAYGSSEDSEGSKKNAAAVQS